jgi:hypothetical protein
MSGMNLEALYGGSFISWENVAESWKKKTVASRLLLFAARKYLEESDAEKKAERLEILEGSGLPEEIRIAFASTPQPEHVSARRWGEFMDASLAAEFEMVSYGERPPILAELKTGLTAAAKEADPDTALGKWFLSRRDALPGSDLPDDPGYLPI